jgi:S-adenosylmethionine:tRNA ribosyltransferase-isomerase
MGIDWQEVELEVGIDTFRLIEEDDPREHTIHTERYHVSQAVVDAVCACRERGGRVIAIGTTSVRSLESAWDVEANEMVARENATTNLFLMPGSEFHVVDAMVTNFHVPRSTLMMLVSAFATREQIMAAYEEAIGERYRMLSFGDAMLIL